MSESPRPEGGGLLRTLLGRLMMPADDWARHDERRPSTLTLLMGAAMVLIAVSGALAVAMWRAGPGAHLLLAALLVSLGAALAIIAVLMHQVRRHLLTPLARLYAWALRMCDGDLDARLPPEQSGRFAKLTFHINRLSEALDRLANEMDDMVGDQTRRLQEKNESLETLYEVAASLNAASDLPAVLEHCAQKIGQILGAEQAEVTLLPESGALAASGARPSPPPAGDGSGRGDAGSISVPLAYKDEVLGRLRVIGAQADLDSGQEGRRLLEGVAQHLGMAIAKARLDEEALQMKLERERTAMAHELHDSLAQTLVSLRMRMHVLDELIEQGAAHEARREFERIEETLGEANTELRELIAQFRAPLGKRGLRPALEELIARMRRDKDMAFFLQAGDLRDDLPPASEMQVLRIVREALTNVVNHSQAQTVRVLVSEVGDVCRVLIEDDGVGFAAPPEAALPGEHIGLSVMRDRAKELGGSLTIDSEPGEGTRVTLEFILPAARVTARCAPSQPASLSRAGPAAMPDPVPGNEREAPSLAAADSSGSGRSPHARGGTPAGEDEALAGRSPATLAGRT